MSRTAKDTKKKPRTQPQLYDSVPDSAGGAQALRDTLIRLAGRDPADPPMAALWRQR